MANEIISHVEMCRREGRSLQRGMSFHTGRGHSILLMSTRRNAPYRDRIEEDGTILVYEGHDEPRSEAVPRPKEVDQPESTIRGTPTENAKFFDAALAYKQRGEKAHPVRVYEKIQQGIWSYNGLFELVDAWQEHDGKRNVYKFKLAAISDQQSREHRLTPMRPRRIIPTAVKLEVWKRDRARCVRCGAEDELHFDHIVPYSKGGTSVTPENIQLLCTRHNLEKSDKIL